MKKVFKIGYGLNKVLVIFACICAGLFVSSCTQDEKDVSLETDIESNDQRYVDYLGQVVGFDEGELQIMDSMILVEGDIIFSKAELDKDIKNYSSAPQVRTSYRTPYKVTATSSIPVNINGIQVNGAAVSNWRNAVISAIADWNALDGDISFYIVDVSMSLANSINIFIGTVQSNNNDAEASFPTSGGNPGANIIINQNTYNSGWNTDTRRVLMTHEIGHCIGLAHSDATETGMIYIPTSCGTNVDTYSIMHHSLSSSNYITPCDKEAFYYLY